MTIRNPTSLISVTQLGKRFNREWIFRNLTYDFEAGKTYAITGPNGSGKSTLLQILWGQLPSTEGALHYSTSNVTIPAEDIYKQVSIAAPYLDLIEEYTLKELIRFHFKMRTLRKEWEGVDLVDLFELNHAIDKPINNFSSGMRQRVKLGLALFTQSNLIFLDEPFTNLDSSGIEWYKKKLATIKDSAIFIASNAPQEYEDSDAILDIRSFKKG